jgi:hypothetical protein
MGQGEVGGNGSVQWTFKHHNPDGTIRDIRHEGPPPLPSNTDDVKVLGVAGGRRAEATDPIDFADIGGRAGLVPGNFKVTLCYASHNDAVAAKEAITLIGNSLVVYVPAVDRRVPANAGRPKEVKVEW